MSTNKNCLVVIAIAAGQDPRADIKKIGGNANVVKKQ